MVELQHWGAKLDEKVNYLHTHAQACAQQHELRLHALETTIAAGDTRCTQAFTHIDGLITGVGHSVGGLERSLAAELRASEARMATALSSFQDVIMQQRFSTGAFPTRMFSQHVTH